MTEATTIAVERQEVPRKRPPGPSLRQIHAQPLPIRTFPLPSFYPSNPLSVLHVAYVWLKHVLRPPPKEPSDRIVGRWSPITRSVHIADPESMRILWEKGFWGKGNLSRSEPNWLKREQVRRGLIEGDISEEFTVSRREDRQRLKWQRAKAEQEAIARTKALELKAPVGPLELLALPNSLADIKAIPRTGLAKMKEAKNAQKQNNSASVYLNGTLANQGEVSVPNHAQPDQLGPTEDIPNREHLQLTREEAFFLVFALGALTVVDGDNHAIPTDRLLALFRSQSYFPARSLDRLSPSDPFLIHYAVYHHFRSIGWCPRPGIKFGVDWLLYLDGPVFNHGEFGVSIVPSFSDPWWRGHPSPTEFPTKSWHWFMGAIRMLSHVFKSMVIVYVDIPPRPIFDLALQEGGIAAALQKYRIREVVVRRWSSNRNR